MAKKAAGVQQFETIGAFMLAHDIAITCLLDALSKNQPATARAVAKAIREHTEGIDDAKYPGVRDKANLYADMIETTTAKPIH